jgi:hypothetical protein
MSEGKMWAVVEEVAGERRRQEQKWGEQNHAPAAYLAILAEEFGEASKEVVEASFAKTEAARADRLAKLRVELVQTAAVAVAMVECLDRHAAKEVDVFAPPVPA